MKWLTTIALFICGLLLTSSNPAAERRKESAMVSFLSEYLDIKYKEHRFETFMYVAAKKQRLYLISGNEVVRSYPISTAQKGIGQKSGSFQTPVGLHKVREKVGDTVPHSGIIREKVFTGNIAEINNKPQAGSGDVITTRVMHLDGLEPGVNKGDGCDSYQRGIMIHGTPDEGLIGQPASHGCVRMKNEDIIELFNLVTVNTYVVILNN